MQSRGFVARLTKGQESPGLIENRPASQPGRLYHRNEKIEAPLRQGNPGQKRNRVLTEKRIYESVTIMRTGLWSELTNPRSCVAREFT